MYNTLINQFSGIVNGQFSRDKEKNYMDPTIKFEA